MKKNRLSGFVRFFGGLFFLINICVAVWLLLCLAAAYTHPATVSYLSIFSLTTHFAIAANIFFIFFWLFSARKLRVLLPLLVLAVSYTLVIRAFGWQVFEENDAHMTENRIKVMSWNVKGMGIFDKEEKQVSDDIRGMIKAESADVLCLPEYYVWKNGKEAKNKNASVIMKENGYEEYRFAVDNTLGVDVELGTAVFSRYPFISYQVHPLGEYIKMLEADMEIDGQRVRMFFVHLNTFGLSDGEKAYIERVKQRDTDLSGGLYRSKSFVTKFNEAFVKRAEEADIAADIIAASPYPVLICGDFNDLPTSYTYTRMRGDLKDAFLEKSFGLGRTYNFILPTIRIDYIFYNADALRLTGFRSPVTTLSDHNPVIGVFEIKNAPEN